MTVIEILSFVNEYILGKHIGNELNRTPIPSYREGACVPACRLQGAK